MHLTILSDNTAGRKCLAEHGFSCYIEINGLKLLFDVGASDIFTRNAKILGINLDEIDWVVLSHGHWDHTNGLLYVHGKKMICHPGSFIKRYKKGDSENIGLQFSQASIESRFDLYLKKDPYFFTDSVIFLGEIPRFNDFESQSTTYIDADGKPDFVPDDTALVIVHNQELIIISGCAHSGICNIIEYAKKVSGINTVRAVIGGFHLKENDKKTGKTIDYLLEKNVKEVFPSHCTRLPALVAFSKVFNFKQIETGSVLEF